MSLDLVKEKINSYVKEINHQESLDLLAKLSSGKMLRSKLVFKIAGISDQTVNICAIIEMIQSASLLHDDVIDEATTRRGQPSINALFDNKTSIMFGDILYSKAFTQLTLLDKNIAYHISNSVTLLSVGEMLDVSMAEEFNDSLDLYLDMIYKKTASLIEASARVAAIISSKDEEKFALYGRNLGIAFQMIDDILDITQTSEQLGKPAMLDFVEGKVTIPYLLLHERLEAEDKEYLKSLFKKPLDEKESLWIKTKMKETNSIVDAIAMANKYAQEAIKAVQDEENTQDLVDIISAMVNRNF
jgi:octaprenyl-diphosphate synthase